MITCSNCCKIVKSTCSAIKSGCSNVSVTQALNEITTHRNIFYDFTHDGLVLRGYLHNPQTWGIRAFTSVTDRLVLNGYLHSPQPWGISLSVDTYLGLRRLGTLVIGVRKIDEPDKFILTSIRKVMARFVTREFVEGSFFSRFFLELQLRAIRGGRNFCNINLSWERRREWGMQTFVVQSARHRIVCVVQIQGKIERNGFFVLDTVR